MTLLQISSKHKGTWYLFLDLSHPAPGNAVSPVPRNYSSAHHRGDVQYIFADLMLVKWLGESPQECICHDLHDLQIRNNGSFGAKWKFLQLWEHITTHFLMLGQDHFVISQRLLDIHVWENGGDQLPPVGVLGSDSEDHERTYWWQSGLREWETGWEHPTHFALDFMDFGRNPLALSETERAFSSSTLTERQGHWGSW